MLAARYFCMLCLMLLASGCATLTQPLEPPSVQLVGLELLPLNGLEQPVRVHLKVVNPNSVDLNPRGISYQLNIQGLQALSGASNELPSLPAYGETEVSLVAGINLISGLSIIKQWLAQPEQPVVYQLKAKLNVGTLWPDLDINESGEVSFLN